MSRIEFTKKMKNDYTILMPNMLEIHFSLIERLYNDYGYNFKLLKNEGKSVAETGLKYVHNDTCYPAILIIGQIIDALNSGEYDVNKVAILMPQTGGGCRASNYIYLLRKAFVKAGYPQIPVISFNLAGMEKNSGFKLTLPIASKIINIIAYGDMLMLLRNQVKPYEVETGSADNLVNLWQNKLCEGFKGNNHLSLSKMKSNFDDIVSSFSKIKINKTPKVKVGIVGEIYIKFYSLGNNNLEEFLLSQNCEYMVPGLMGFVSYNIDSRIEDIRLYGGSKIKSAFTNLFFAYIKKIESIFIKSIRENSDFLPQSYFTHTKSLVEGIIGYGTKMGEGWLLTAEMLELCEHGYENIVCTQPFGCLPNHIAGKGTFRSIKNKCKNANITAIDYDPGAARVNQENRIKLMLSIAKEKLAKNNHETATTASAAIETLQIVNTGQTISSCK